MFSNRTSLYSLSKHEAVFVETEENVNIYSSDESPFVCFAQLNRSKNVIKVPISYLHALADKIGDPSVPVVWVSTTGRCGSTVLCQTFEKVPGTLYIAEPDAPSNIDIM